MIDADAVYAAVDLAEAIERTRAAFERHANGEWAMPAKVYLDSPPHGDFRAMPARGDGFALLKWVTSFPGNSERGLPVVTGALLLSDASTGELKAIMDCAAVTSLRTGAAAAVSALVLAPEAARTVGIVGCGVNGTWSARSLATAGYGPGICADQHPEAARRLAAELGWRAGDRAEAAQQDVVVTVTRGDAPVILASDLVRVSIWRRLAPMRQARRRSSRRRSSAAGCSATSGNRPVAEVSSRARFRRASSRATR